MPASAPLANRNRSIWGPDSRAQRTKAQTVLKILRTGVFFSLPGAMWSACCPLSHKTGHILPPPSDPAPIPRSLSLTHMRDAGERATLAWPDSGLSFVFALLQTIHRNISSTSGGGRVYFFPALTSWIYREPDSSSPKLLCLLLKPKATSHLAAQTALT